ncbi:MAG: YHYH protein [Bacteroidota bacterium]
MTKSLLFACLLLSVQAFSQCDPTEVFSNDSTNAVCVEVDDKVRTIYANNLPNHPVGTWPSNNPIDPQEFTYFMCAFPQKGDQPVSIYDSGDFMGCPPYIEFGVSTNGVRLAPFGARWFVNPNTQQENRDWNVEPLEMFMMDFNNSHSNGGGQYHYHGVPIRYFGDSLGIDGSAHSPVIGYAADGFPIYYKYLYTNPNDPNGGISSFSAGHTLKPGNRPGNGITAPDGPHDGFYVEDYEFLDDDWPLDECNGRFGKTPEYPEGTYYYVMTDNWPHIPRCFFGTVIDNSFRNGMNCPSSTAEDDCSEEVISSIDQVGEVELTIAPNPTASSIQLLFSQADFGSQITQLSIYDLTGKIWYQASNYQQEILLNDLPSGSYFLQIDTEQTQLTKKILLQK